MKKGPAAIGRRPHHSGEIEQKGSALFALDLFLFASPGSSPTYAQKTRSEEDHGDRFRGHQRPPKSPYE